MNKVILTGRLTAAPELRTTTNGKSVTEFTIAVDRFGDDIKQADFIRCTAYNRQADNLCRYKAKGDLIAVVGALRVDKYKDMNGNDRYKEYVLASEIEYIGGKTAGRDPDNGQIPDEANDDDFPF